MWHSKKSVEGIRLFVTHELSVKKQIDEDEILMLLIIDEEIEKRIFIKLCPKHGDGYFKECNCIVSHSSRKRYLFLFSRSIQNAN